MLTLALLRHAKSNWDDPSQADFHRPLAPRGIEAAPRIGRWMAGHNVRPDLVLCSTATRTRATLDLLLPELGAPAPQVRYRHELYLASAPDLLGVIHGARAATLLLIGHNPGLHVLARTLAGRGKRENLGALGLKLPTAGLVVLRFDARRWTEVNAGGGELVDFVQPRRLP